jgi:hypothetical protein
MAEKGGFCQYGKKVGFLLILEKNGAFVSMAKEWSFCQYDQKVGFCQYGKKVGFLSIWQKSGGFVNMAKKLGFS